MMPQGGGVKRAVRNRNTHGPEQQQADMSQVAAVSTSLRSLCATCQGRMSQDSII